MDTLHNGLKTNRAMAVASFSALPMTISMSMTAPYPKNKHTEIMRCRWKCPPLNVRCPLQFQAAASPRRNRRRSVPKPEKLQKNEGEEDLGEAALEALFSQLEKDLENNEFHDDDDDEITEEEMSRFEDELREALLDVEQDDEEALPDVEDILPEDEHALQDALLDDKHALLDFSTLKLEDWQLQKLSAALELGRRKVSVKKLKEELGLDRRIVLQLLRNPSPQLLLFQDSTDKTKSSESGSKSSDSVSASLAEIEAQKNETEDPIYVNQGKYMRKRMKKVHIATLEKVYRSTRRPTDAMVANIVHLTHLPRKAILKWFDDKRSQDSTKYVYNKQQ